MPNYLYQTLQVTDSSVFKGGPSASGQGWAAGVKLLHKATQFLNELALSMRVNNEIKALDDEIQRKMPSGGGVLLCVESEEWAMPDATGARAKGFLGVFIAEVGMEPLAALKKYKSAPNLVQGPNEGWRRVETFVWVTPASK